MGAWMTTRVATGANASQAWKNAVREANAYSGHQEGYSGDVNSGGYGFVKVELPGRLSLDKFIELLLEEEENGTWKIESAKEDVRAWNPGGVFNRTGKKKGWKGNLAKAQRALTKAIDSRARFVRKVEAAGFYYPNFESLARTFHDKWGDYLCVEVSAHLAKKKYPNAYASKRRGDKVFVFFGYSPT